MIPQTAKNDAINYQAINLTPKNLNLEKWSDITICLQPPDKPELFLYARKLDSMVL